MGIFPIYNNIQNINQIKSELINYNYQVPTRIEVPKNKLFSKNNSFSYLSPQEKKILPNFSSTLPNEIKNENITTKIDNPQPIRIQKKIFKRMLDFSKPMQASTSDSNLIGKIQNFEKIKANSNKINILDDEKNNFSLLDIKPIEKMVPSASSQILPQRKNNIIKITQPLTARNKILGKNLNKNMNKYIHDNYFTNIDNSSNINVNNSVELNNRNNNILLNSYNSINGIKNITFEQTLNQSINNLNDFTNLNKTDNSIKKIFQKKNNYLTKIYSYNDFIRSNEINDKTESFNNNELQINAYDYAINKDNINNNNYQQIINNNYNINNIYNINSNIIPIQYIKINKDENLDPESNFNLSEFIKIKELGKGTEGIIYSVKWIKNNKIYALKKSRIKTLDYVKKKQEEIKMLKEFRNKTGNDGIIRIYGEKCIRDKNGIYEFYEIMEFAQKDWDQEVYSRGYYGMFYQESELMEIMAQIVRTFSLLQKNKITHRDIKPQNIMIVNGEFKIADFGNSRLLKREGYCVQRIRGSEMYMSPVMFRALHAKMPQVKHNTYKSDVFSLGMCFLLVASLSYAPLNTIREIYDMNTIYKVINYYISSRYSQNVINILYAMLQVEENLRPDFIQLESMFPSIYFV